MYDTLILSGNSTNVFVTLGSIQYLLDNTDRLGKSVRNYIGTSSGSIICLLTMLGYSPLDLLCHICVNKIYRKISLNVSSMLLTGKGLINFDTIEKEIEYLIVEKIGFIPTLEELSELTGNDLYAVAYNMSTDKKEYVSRYTHPDLSCTKAVRMSSTFPFVFEPYHHDGYYYVDGGIADNFAIEFGEMLGKNCLGIYTRNPQKPYVEELGYIGLIHKLVQVFLNSMSDDKISRINRSDILTINHIPNFFNFTSENRDIIVMFDTGYALCKQEYTRVAVS